MCDNVVFFLHIIKPLNPSKTFQHRLNLNIKIPKKSQIYSNCAYNTWYFFEFSDFFVRYSSVFLRLPGKKIKNVLVFIGAVWKKKSLGGPVKRCSGMPYTQISIVLIFSRKMMLRKMNWFSIEKIVLVFNTKAQVENVQVIQ